MTRPLMGPDLWFVPWGLVLLILSIGLTLSIFVLLSHQHSLPEALLPLAGIPLTLVGLFGGYIAGVHPFVVRYWELPNTYYAVTNQRLLILRTWPKRSLRTLAIEDICELKTVVCPDGRRTIIFTSDPELSFEKASAKSYFWFVNIQDFGSLDRLIEDLRKRTEAAKERKPAGNRCPAKHQLGRWQRIMAAAGLLFILTAMIALYAEVRRTSVSQRQEYAKAPHTVRILGYQLTFPKEIPEGYDGGTIDLDYSDNLDRSKQGKQGRTRRATWDLWRAEKSPFAGGMQFMVNEFAQPMALPEDWQAPPHWKKLRRTSLGAKEVAGVKFAVTRCTAEVYYWPDEKNALEKAAQCKVSEEQFLLTHGYKISAVEYLAHDNGKLIGLRGYGYGDHNVIITLTNSMLNTFRKVKFASPAPDYGKDFPDTDPYSTATSHTGNSAEPIDPYAELIKP